jgi:hypothetical protein
LTGLTGQVVIGNFPQPSAGIPVNRSRPEQKLSRELRKDEAIAVFPETMIVDLRSA